MHVGEVGERIAVPVQDHRPHSEQGGEICRRGGLGTASSPGESGERHEGESEARGGVQAGHRRETPEVKEEGTVPGAPPDVKCGKGRAGSGSLAVL